MARDSDDRQPFDGGVLAAYVQTLYPMQQQAIATAQLAGCRFERRTYERDVGAAVWRQSGPPTRRSRWINTTEYEIFLPDGTSAGFGEDIYICAVTALALLNHEPKEADTSLFKLNPENEPK